MNNTTNLFQEHSAKMFGAELEAERRKMFSSPLHARWTFSISICEHCMQGELRLFFFLFLFVNNWTLQAGWNSYLYLYWNLFNIDYSDIKQCKNWKVDDNHDCKYKFIKWDKNWISFLFHLCPLLSNHQYTDSAETSQQVFWAHLPFARKYLLKYLETQIFQEYFCKPSATSSSSARVTLVKSQPATLHL